MFTVKAVEDSGVPFKDYSANTGWLRYRANNGREYLLRKNGRASYSLYAVHNNTAHHVRTMIMPFRPTNNKLRDFHEQIYEQIVMTKD